MATHTAGLVLDLGHQTEGAPVLILYESLYLIFGQRSPGGYRAEGYSRVPSSASVNVASGDSRPTSKARTSPADDFIFGTNLADLATTFAFIRAADYAPRICCDQCHVPFLGPGRYNIADRQPAAIFRVP
ncbi:uncharacterized protein PFL1_02198 [Pseudozyma flocculosa PF-1]|uniref:uncharacterized protein n=1 Tax=Pseudozyma flocculosa PF-1 TaxID=1277687 RepID=UPI00045602E4|nr:uncharacterized protein PFL1_02198 [Pseudozyma flocculosa PF-1]EPQ30081.1 hypothetical protein PFL1_02198 [Pseudozyma flocculosa PF-1]